MGLILRCHLWCFTKILIQSVIARPFATERDRLKMANFTAIFPTSIWRIVIIFERQLNACQWLFFCSCWPNCNDVDGEPRSKCMALENEWNEQRVMHTVRRWNCEMCILIRFNTSDISNFKPYFVVFTSSVSILAHPLLFAHRTRNISWTPKSYHYWFFIYSHVIYWL